MRHIILALFAALALQAQEWTREDTYWQSAVVAASIADWIQTRQIAKDRGEYRMVTVFHGNDANNMPIYTKEPFEIRAPREEMNPLLGKRPSLATVDAYFAAGIAANCFIARHLNPKARRRFQGFCLGWEAAIVAHNFKVGLRIKF